MLEIIRDENKNIQAVLEFYAVNAKGEWDEKGIYCWINEVEVNKSYRNSGSIKQFVKIITSKYPQFQFGYFWRKKKYPDRSPRIYTKRQWLKIVK